MDTKTRSPLRELIDGFVALKDVGRAFWVCNLVYFLDGAAYFGILNLLTLFVHRRVGLSDEWTGLTVSYFTGLVTFFSATLGGLSDRLGVRRTITLTTLLALGGRVLLTIAPHAPFFPSVVALFGLTFMAAAAGALIPACYAGVKQATTERSAAIGFSLLYALMNGGIVVESYASSLVRARFGIDGVFWMCAMLTAAYLVIHWFAFPRREGGPVPRSLPTGNGSDSKKGWRSHALLNPRFQFFIFVLLGVRTLFAHQWLTMPDYVTRAYPAAVGARFEWITGLNPLIVLIGTPLLAGLTRRVHVVTMMIAGTLVSAAATFLLVPGPNLSMLLGYQIVFSIGEALWSSRFLEYVADVAPPDQVGVYMGVAQIPWFIAKFTTGFYSGFFLNRLCPPTGIQRTGTMWLVYAIFGMTTPIGLLMARKWLIGGRIAESEKSG